MSTYADKGPDFLPDNPRSNLIARIHDMYITTIQGALYKATPPFGIYRTRSDALDELKLQLKVINDLIEDDKDGIYLCGNEVSLADASLFPTMIFIAEMLPKFGIDDGVPSKLANWFMEVREKDADFAKVYDEVRKHLCSTSTTLCVRNMRN
jgi:glutathione S-transferase